MFSFLCFEKLAVGNSSERWRLNMFWLAYVSYNKHLLKPQHTKMVFSPYWHSDNLEQSIYSCSQAGNCNLHFMYKPKWTYRHRVKAVASLHLQFCKICWAPWLHVVGLYFTNLILKTDHSTLFLIVYRRFACTILNFQL